LESAKEQRYFWVGAISVSGALVIVGLALSSFVLLALGGGGLGFLLTGAAGILGLVVACSLASRS
jgi:glycine/D-amino acid oxidase-like deaminating enzyme